MLMCLPLYLQGQVTTYLQPTNEFLGPYRRLAVKECNETNTSQVQTYASVAKQVAAKGFVVALHTELLRAQAHQEKRSWQRTTLLAVEIAGWLTTALIASDLVQIKEKYKAAVPLVTGGIRFATTVIKQEPEPLPAVRQNVVQIDAGACNDSVLYVSDIVK